MPLPKIEMTADTLARLEALRNVFQPILTASKELAVWADHEQKGAKLLAVAWLRGGQKAINTPAVRFRMSVLVALAHGLEGLADQFRDAAEAMNSLLPERADFNQDDGDLCRELVPLEVTEALEAGE